MIVLTRDDVRDCIDMPEAVRSVESALRSVAEGRAHVPLRIELRLPDGGPVTRYMPGALVDVGAVGCKLIAEVPANSGRNLPALTGLMVLFDFVTGFPVATMDATYLTNLRTGALTAVAAKYLAPAGARVATVVGAGGLAVHQVLGLLEVLDVERVRLWGRSHERARAVLDAVVHERASAAGRVELAADLEEAVRCSDVVVVATSAHHPVVEDAWIKHGALVCSMSGEGPEACEIPPRLVGRADRVVVDSRDGTLTRAGELRKPIDDGDLDERRVVELGSVLTGDEVGRRSGGGLVVFKSCGMAALDLAVSSAVTARAAEQALGTTIDLLGRDLNIKHKEV